MAEKNIINQLAPILDNIQEICHAGSQTGFTPETAFILDEVERATNAMRTGQVASRSLPNIGLPSAEFYCELAVKSIEQIPKIQFSQEQRGFLNVELGKAYFLLGDLDAAKLKLSSALAVAQQLNLTGLHAEALKRLGDIDFRRNDYSEAERLYNESLLQYQKAESLEGQGTIYNDLGTIAFYSGDWPVAEGYFSKCKEIAEQLNHTRLLAKVNNNLGASHNVRGQYEAAVSCFEAALPRFEQMGDWNGVAEVYHNIGLCHARQNNWLKAGECYERSTHFSKRAQNVYLTATTFMHRAELCIQICDFNVAQHYCSQALDIFIKIGNKEGLADGYKLLASIHRRFGQFEVAKIYLGKALGICLEIKNRLNEAETLAEYARVARDQGDEEDSGKKFDLAFSIFQAIDAKDECKKLSEERSRPKEQLIFKHDLH